MPAYYKPRNDLARVAFLRQAARTAQLDAAAGDAYLSQSLIDQADAAAQALSAAQLTADSCLSQRSREVEQRNEALQKLAYYVRDFWEVARRRMRRLEQPDAVLTFYGLHLDGATPNPSRAEEWLLIAAHVVQGESQAVAAGYPPMSNPSAAELTAVLETAQTAVSRVTTADRAYDQAQEALAAQRAQADRLIAEMMTELRFALRRHDAPSQRRILRNYGATFTDDARPQATPQI
ncbi:MAG: hypothetical protein H6659_00750 [Ardenticatenaceae bacterium]|nr:hypothetical protein [Ardenticatenaceae bacterium]